LQSLTCGRGSPNIARRKFLPARRLRSSKTPAKCYVRTNLIAFVLSLANTVAQTGVLGIALSSLADGVNEIPAPAAIALEVAGLAAVATVALAGFVARFAIWALVDPEGQS